MRASILTVLSLMAFAGCGDDRTPSAPTTLGSTRSSSTVVGAASVVASGVGVPGAKPTPQVGFTKVEYVESATAYAPTGGGGTAWAYCPPGSVPIGGGHRILAGVNQPFPLVYTNTRYEGNGKLGWTVSFTNWAAGAESLSFVATVLCAS